MTIEQTIEIPVSRRVFFDLPLEMPVGKARVELTCTPEPSPLEKSARPLESLLGIHKGLDTMDAYFERKRADKLLEAGQTQEGS